jgi:large subunit ribosomal protein L30e
MDIEKELARAMQTGRVVLGTDRSLKAVKRGEAKLVILASNCPEDVADDFKHYSEISELKVIHLDKNSRELGIICGVPFTVNVLAVIDPGDSAILSAVGSG